MQRWRSPQFFLVSISRIQELARYPQASPLPVLQAGEG
jgi:hypothetical protein